MKFKNYIETESGIKDTSASPGTAGQLLSSTVAGTSWIDQNTISSGTSEVVDIQVKNISSANGGINLVKGDPVYIYGSVGASARLYVDLADADSTATNNLGDGKMPCVGLLDQDLSPNGEGTATVVGKLRNLITSPIDGDVPNENDTVYVKSGGGLTLTKPTGSTNLIQNVGQVGRVSTSADGNIVVAALLRTNDVPNLPEGRLFVGTAANTSLASDVVYVDDTNNRVGIRTAFPLVAFHVDGAIRVRGDLQVSQQNNNTFVGENMTDLTVITGSNNTALGDSVMPGATSASFNTGIGALSLNAFVTGNNNTAVGTDSMKLSNGASFNTAIGTGSLKAATVGQGNTAIGFSALGEKTTTNFNTAVGNNSLRGITTGFRNTAVGNDAGRFTSDGITSNSTGKNSVFIGDSAKANADNQTNQIVIGQGAVGEGSNSVVIGNSSIVKTILKGSVGVGIGTTSPQAKLHVANGTLRTWTPTSGTSAIFESTVSNRNFVTLTAANEAELWFGDATTQAKGRIRYEIRNSLVNLERMEFWTNATEKMVIDGSGNVGIGAENPGEKLHVSGSGGVRLQVESTDSYEAALNLTNTAGSYGSFVNSSGGLNTYDYNAASFRTTLLANGNFGINTTSPNSRLQVGGEIDASGGDGYRINGMPWAAESSNNLKLGDWDGEGFSTSIYDDNSAEIVIVKDYGAMISCSSLTSSYGADASLAVGLGTGGAAVLTLSNTDANPSSAGDATGIIQFAIKDDQSGLGYTSALIRGSISQAAGQGNGGGGILDFYTAPYGTGNSPQLRMRINDIGKVGIGTTSPQSKLQVNGGVQLANDTASPSASKVGTFRYRTSGNNSYVDMCMQTGASTYAWVNIVTNSW